MRTLQDAVLFSVVRGPSDEAKTQDKGREGLRAVRTRTPCLGAVPAETGKPPDDGRRPHAGCRGSAAGCAGTTLLLQPWLFPPRFRAADGIKPRRKGSLYP